MYYITLYTNLQVGERIVQYYNKHGDFWESLFSGERLKEILFIKNILLYKFGARLKNLY